LVITGDARPVAEAVAADLGFRPGVDEVFVEVLPADKDRAVADLQARGLRVAMVGDGVNDAPALARADVGVAIGAGTDVAIESAGVVLASSDPRGVTGVIRLSWASYRKMIQNLAWAAGYNVLAWAGITLSPAIGAVLRSASTIVVALNAQLLRRVRLTPTGGWRPASTMRHRPRARVGPVTRWHLTASIGRTARWMLLLSTVFGLAMMHTLGHAGMHMGHGDSHGAVQTNPASAGMPATAIDPTAIMAVTVVMAMIAPECTDGTCPDDGAMSGWSICLAVLGGLAIAVLFALLLRCRRQHTIDPHTTTAVRAIPRPPPTAFGVTVRSTAVLRI
jgi:magnesium-transporting ATPase (P-type)